jgi:hypothetical protein
MTNDYGNYNQIQIKTTNVFNDKVLIKREIYFFFINKREIY